MLLIWSSKISSAIMATTVCSWERFSIETSIRNHPRYSDYWTYRGLGASDPWGGMAWSTWDAPCFPRTVRALVTTPAPLVPVLAVRPHGGEVSTPALQSEQEGSCHAQRRPLSSSADCS